jgi:acetyltransferase
LLQRLINIGRDEHLDLITADILADNSAMQRVSEKLGFHLCHSNDSTVVKVEFSLGAAVQA